MKIIKFDLPINGIKAKNLEELRDNITDEIVGLARSGQGGGCCGTQTRADLAAGRMVQESPTVFEAPS